MVVVVVVVVSCVESGFFGLFFFSFFLFFFHFVRCLCVSTSVKASCILRRALYINMPCCAYIDLYYSPPPPQPPPPPPPLPLCHQALGLRAFSNVRLPDSYQTGVMFFYPLDHWCGLAAWISVLL